MKFLTWNICNKSINVQKRMDDLRKVIAKFQPDIVALQEVTPLALDHFLNTSPDDHSLDDYCIYDSDSGFTERSPSLYEDDDVCLFEDKPDPPKSHFLVILSKWGIRDLQRTLFPVTVHQRYMMTGVIMNPWTKKKYFICNTHLESYPHHEKMRHQQLRHCFVTALTASHTDVQVILGDCNILETDTPYTSLKGFHDAWLDVHDHHEGWTYDFSQNPMIRGKFKGRIDRMYLKGATCISGTVIQDPIISDHFGLFLELES